jgi:hypothetical protein
MTARSLALFFATQHSKLLRAASSAPPLGGAGCTDSYWYGSARPTAASIPARWPGITVGLSRLLLPARPRKDPTAGERRQAGVGRPLRNRKFARLTAGGRRIRTTGPCVSGMPPVSRPSRSTSAPQPKTPATQRSAIRAGQKSPLIWERGVKGGPRRAKGTSARSTRRNCWSYPASASPNACAISASRCAMSCPASARTCATITFRAPAGWSPKKASPSTIGGAASVWRTGAALRAVPEGHAGDDGHPDPHARVLARGLGGTGPGRDRPRHGGGL